MRAFTLVEILVALAIVAIGTSIAVATWHDDGRGAAMREARRFAAALEYAAARAQWRNETLGVSADAGGTGWRFWRRSGPADAWRPVSDDATLAPHALSATLALIPVAYAGRPLARDSLVPLRASGRNDPYAFVLVHPDARFVVAADPLNRVAVTEEAQ